MADDIISIAPIGGVNEHAPGHGDIARYGNAPHHHAPPRQDSADISIATGQQAQSLLYCSALDQIRAQLGLNSPMPARHQPADALASRSQQLMHGIAALFDGYRQNRADQSLPAALAAFIDGAQAGLQAGFRETCDVLRQLKVLHPQIVNELEHTRSQTAALLRDFRP